MTESQYMTLYFACGKLSAIIALTDNGPIRDELERVFAILDKIVKEDKEENE